MAKVIYKREIGVNMLGELEYTILPTCPVCGECLVERVERGEEW